MPIFEYVCKGCGNKFEAIVYGSKQSECPACKGTELEQQLSTFAAHGTDKSSGVGSHDALRMPARLLRRRWLRNELADGPVAAAGTKTRPPDKPPHPWAKRLGPLAPLALLLAKGKTLLFALFKLKFLFSFAAFLGIYWALYGAWFGIGFAVMILLHEMGHFVEVKRRGLPAEMPVFLPGLGAYVKWQALGVSTETRALVSLAGPAAGLLAALHCRRPLLADRQSSLGRAGSHRSVAQSAQSDSCVDAGWRRGRSAARQDGTRQSARL